jgi:hypothetical protein
MARVTAAITLAFWVALATAVHIDARKRVWADKRIDAQGWTLFTALGGLLTLPFYVWARRSAMLRPRGDEARQSPSVFQRTPEERAEDEARAAAFAAAREPASDEGERPAAGWYPDPLHNKRQRYWDGEAWEHDEHTSAPVPGHAVTENPGVGSYAVAVVIPIVGVGLAIREFARDNIGPALALLLTSIVAGLGFYVVLSSSGSNGKCIVTALGGQKLCGDDAKAWCDATDSLRVDSDATEAQRVCDDIRSE